MFQQVPKYAGSSEDDEESDFESNAEEDEESEIDLMDDQSDNNFSP